MIASPIGLERPLVVVGGWRTPRFTASWLGRDLARLAGAELSQVLPVGVLACRTMEGGVGQIIRAVEQRWPSRDPALSIEVDVVGISMGGLLARAAALPAPGRKQLNIRRLFTIGTPHRGAVMAGRITVDALSRDMRAGSPFLGRLDEGQRTSIGELICYARTHDVMVGAANSAPPGHHPYWLHGPRFLSHVTMWADPLIRLDIARRLRGEEPLARRPSPPPRD
jgi:pimeloyl-ACP methyl ester carboxylesterase